MNLNSPPRTRRETTAPRLLPLNRHSLRVGVVLASLCAAATASADLIHRYSFTANANDSVGTAHGTAVQRSDANGPLGVAVEFSGGQALLDGTGGYIDLPNGIISKYTTVTIEAWVTWNGIGNWARIFDFGNSTTGETSPSQDIGTGLNYMFLTPNGNNTTRARFAITDASNGGERPVLNDPEFFPLEQAHVAIVYGSGIARMFVNGREAASGTAEVPLSALQDVNNWLGRSNWPDPMFGGSFNEFRIHNNLLGLPEIVASSTAGPDAINYDPGAITAITLTVEGAMLLGQTQVPQITGTFDNIGQVTLGTADVTVTSSAANIVRVNPTGSFTAVGVGNATIRVSRGTQSATANVSVSPASPAELKHRYSFNDAPGATTVVDSVGGANGDVVASVAPAAAPSLANGQLNLPGGAYQTAGYVDLPNNLISVRTNITIEVWTTWNGPANNNWQRIFDFGDSQKGEFAQAPGNGLGYLFLTPRAGATGNPVRFAARPNATTAESPVLNVTPALPVGQQVHLTVVYAPEFGNSRLYVNGVLAATGGAPFALSALTDPNIWIGASNYNDPPYNGMINEFRIYEGPLTDIEVALSRHAGPDAFADPPGALQSISLTAPDLFPGNPAAVQASLKATFQNVSGVEILGISGITLSSTDTNIFTVNATGGLLPRNRGTASLIATFQGLSSTTAVTVTLPTALRHDLASTSLTAGQVIVNATLRADFPSAQGVNVNGYAGVTRASSDPKVLTIAANGNVAAVGPGTATITSTYQGLTAQTEITVSMPSDFQRGELIHRYSFTEARDTATVADSVGTAHGEVVGLVPGGTANNFTGTGELDMAGSAWNANPLGAYVNLPNRLVSTLSSVTLEGWATWRGGANQRYFDFGMSSGAPDGAGGFDEDVVLNPGRSYMFLTPSGPRFALKEGTGPEVPNITSSIAITAGAKVHYAVVYDQPRGVARLYINGQRAGTAAATLPLSVVDDRNNWLGRSVWQDPLFNGLVDEFRIYNGPLLDSDIAANFAAGPDALPVARPTLTARLTGGNLVIEWEGGGTIETTDKIIGGTWNNTGRTSPASIPVGELANTVFIRARR